MTPVVHVVIQEEDFAESALLQSLHQCSRKTGAIVEFTGCVRADETEAGQVSAIFLEHYPGMTESSLQTIVNQACSRWTLHAVTVIHRVGLLQAGENIVYVGAAAPHRKSALAGVDFIMDYLKNDVPIWKKELSADGEQWVAQKTADLDAKKHWE